MRHLKDNLMVQFSVVSLVVMAIVALGLAIVVSNKVRSHSVDMLIDEAVGASSGRLLDAITAADLEAPMTGTQYALFHSFVQRWIVSERIARIKIWAKDGTIVYSDNQAEVGKEFPFKENLQKALAGETVSEVAIPEDPDRDIEGDSDVFMEVYTPILFPGDTEPQGALEVYQYYAPTAQRINTLRFWIFGAMGVAFVALYGSVGTIVWRGWTAIVRQQRRLESFNADLDGKSGPGQRTFKGPMQSWPMESPSAS